MNGNIVISGVSSLRWPGELIGVYERQFGRLCHGRPLYKLKGTILSGNRVPFLFFCNRRWIIGPTVGNDNAWMYAIDLASTPSQIKSQWNVISDGSADSTPRFSSHAKLRSDNDNNLGGCYFLGALINIDPPLTLIRRSH